MEISEYIEVYKRNTDNFLIKWQHAIVITLRFVLYSESSEEL